MSMNPLRSIWHGWDANRRLIAVCAIGLFLLIGWAAIAQVDEITRGMGKVIPSSKVQLIQASEPSTIASIQVRPGQLVKKGDLLVQLENAQSQSQMGQLQAENERLTARANRLQGEGSGAGSGACEGVACEEEAQLAAVRRATAASKQSALAAQIEQRRRDLSEGQATIASLEGSVRLAQQQVDTLAPMVAKKVIPQTELISAQRELVDVQGRLSAARQGAARASAAIQEAQAQFSEARLDFRQQALNERSEVATKLAVNEQTIKGSATELRAPVTGFVNDVKVNTVGGFVGAGEKVMQIVPQGDKLLIEARVTPKDIAFIKEGDRAVVKVTAYDFSIYGGLTGQVRNISADSIYDENERQAYYIVVIETDRAFIEKNGRKLPIMPGMICDAEIITGRKSILSYLFKPVLKAFGEAMTER
ncbi:HlyD family type I secretion periplasmic adaptor subunit [Novosphingobium aquiterrae]|uniref:Membrane fusion protein (MFP) family protein n=1 Tax=Novosphingobium aquiterrae TaxID=624388 RepID=A0ABV6PKR3_9SPHN